MNIIKSPNRYTNANKSTPAVVEVKLRNSGIFKASKINIIKNILQGTTKLLILKILLKKDTIKDTIKDTTSPN